MTIMKQEQAVLLDHLRQYIDTEIQRHPDKVVFLDAVVLRDCLDAILSEAGAFQPDQSTAKLRIYAACHGHPTRFASIVVAWKPAGKVDYRLPTAPSCDDPEPTAPAIPDTPATS